MAKHKFTGQLYQLTSKKKLHVGAYVEINGPWDTYGVVMNSTPQAEGGFLNLIRGVKERHKEKPVASI